MTSTKLNLILAVTILLGLGSNNVLAQKNPDEPAIIKGDSNSCELNAAYLDMLANMARSSNERIFVIARLGRGEQSSLISRRRLQSVREQFVRVRALSAQRIILAEGDYINDDGRIEYYFGSKLIFVSLAGRNEGLCLSCCDDPPSKSSTRKRRKRN